MNQTNEEGTNEVTQTSEREKGGRGGVLTLSYAISDLYCDHIYDVTRGGVPEKV